MPFPFLFIFIFISIFMSWVVPLCLSNEDSATVIQGSLVCYRNLSPGRYGRCVEAWVCSDNRLPWVHYYKQVCAQGGACVAPSVEQPTLSFGSGQDLMVHGFESHIRFHADSTEPAWDPLPPPPSASSPPMCFGSLSQNK